MRRLPDHHAGQHEQQRGLGERGHALDLAMAVMMLVVGRLAGNAHGEIGHHGGEKSISECAASDSSASEPDSKPTMALAAVKPGRDGDRRERDLFLLALHALWLSPNNDCVQL